MKWAIVAGLIVFFTAILVEQKMKQDHQLKAVQPERGAPGIAVREAGEWNPDQIYLTGDSVTRNGKTYIFVGNQGNDPEKQQRMLCWSRSGGQR